MKIFSSAGFKIKKGWNINIDARSIHLDPTLYKDPTMFIPSRFDVRLHFQTMYCFLPSIENIRKKKKLISAMIRYISHNQGESKPNSFLAFGTGGRTCLGMNMAKAMMLVFLHRLITTYK